MDETKKDYWDITVDAEQVLTVVFEEEVTAKEAEELFNKGLYHDVIDEDTYRYKVKEVK